jgi:hypothetical protein
MKYKSKLVEYTGYVFAGSSISCILWGILSLIVVNPYNIPKTESQLLESGEIERFFGFEVSGNMVKFFVIYGIFNFACSMFTSICFKMDNKEEQFASQKSLEKNPILGHSFSFGRIVGGVEKSVYYSILGKGFGLFFVDRKAQLKKNRLEVYIFLVK